MKLLFCGACHDIRALDPEGAWTVCRCGNLEARWLDPHRGTVGVRAMDREVVRIIGVHNGFLSGAFDPSVEKGDNIYWRNLHGIATVAPGYLFDEHKRGCWAAIIKVGETNDVFWETTQPGSIS